MTFPYPINTQIPNAPNDPADDQPEMKKNYANIAGFLQVDHVAAGTNPGAGYHKQVRFFSPNIPAAIGNPTESVAFTANAAALGGNAQGTASTIVQEFYRSQSGIFPVVAIKAFAYITVVLGPNPTLQTRSNTFNVTSVNRTTSGNYQVVLATSATNSNNYSILCTASSTIPVIVNTLITGVATFDISFNRVVGGTIALFDPITFSFAVLQT